MEALAFHHRGAVALGLRDVHRAEAGHRLGMEGALGLARLLDRFRAEGIAEEREACATKAEEYDRIPPSWTTEETEAAHQRGREIAAAIRFILDAPAMTGQMIALVGPTGAGKTTTLYAALREINTVDAKLLTAEDPVEYDIEGIMQVPINETNIGRAHV